MLDLTIAICSIEILADLGRRQDTISYLFNTIIKNCLAVYLKLVTEPNLLSEYIHRTQ